MSDKYLLPQKAEGVLTPFLIVCEGISDARFLCELLEYKGISTCSVGCPSSAGLGKGGGLEAIPKYLLAIKAITKGKETPRGILIVADADDKPDQRFSLLKKALTDADFPAPTKPFIIQEDTFRVAVYLIPKKGKNGTLDGLLLEAALKNDPKMRVCLNAFCDCTGKVGSWTQNQRSKMRLSALVAASCQDNPWASANTMWSQQGCPVPIDSDCFAHIADFLMAFAST